jgi:hypothetical protein
MNRVDHILLQFLDTLRSGAGKERMRFSCAWDCIIAFSIISGEIATSIALRTSPFWIAGDTREKCFRCISYRFNTGYNV